MKVNAISVQNFSGIMTNSRYVRCDNHGGGYDGWNDRFEPSYTYDYYEREYYPFSNESAADIKRIIAPYEKSIDRSEESSQDEVKVIVKQTLPVTKDTFTRYINNDLYSSEDGRVRDSFLRKGLKCFLRENYLQNCDKYTIL